MPLSSLDILHFHFELAYPYNIALDFMLDDSHRGIADLILKSL